ncbi:MAG TPA: hypothetical protein VF623_13145, partial [Segetibacter sp.]
ELRATFKFYMISANDGSAPAIELGASILANAGITTGPILWHTIGGGFEFNTKAQTFSVFLTGDIGTVGTPKEVCYIKEAKLAILFDLKNCSGFPVVDGKGTLMLRNKNYAEITAKVDFCRTLLLVTVKSTVQITPGIDAYVTGVVYAMTENVNGKQTGSVFFGVNANISSVGDLLAGNIFFGLGVNYNNNGRYSPSEIKEMWSKIDYAAKDNNGTVLNGLFINGSMNAPGKSGNFGLSIGSFKAIAFNYNFSASGTIKLYQKFSNNNFLASAVINASADATVTVIGLSLSGKAVANISLAGGYDGKWWVNGSGGLQMQIYNNEGSGCNSFSATLVECCCSNIHHPCCGNPFRSCCYDWSCYSRVCLYKPSVNFKFCKSLGASFKYRQGTATSATFSLN